MTEPKGHHFVPKFLIKRFCGINGKIWCHRKNSPNLFESNNIDVFKRRRLYSKIYMDGTIDNEMEGVYSSIESSVAPIIDRICSEINNFGICSPLSSDESDLLKKFAIINTRRNPIYLDSALPEFTKEFAAQTILDDDKIPETLRQKCLDALEDEAFFASIRRNSRIFTELPSANMGGLLKNKSISFGITPKNKQFVIGDFPHVMLNNDAFGSDLNEFWVVIDPKIGICLHSFSGTSKTLILERHQVRRINLETYRHSTMICSSSRELLESIRKRR